MALRGAARRWRNGLVAALIFDLLVLVGLLLAGCAPAIDGGGDGPPPPVVLISIDTLRADRLPAYGYTGVATPALDRLAADGVVYERAWSHYPLTLPSHASVFSGLLPPDHGVRDNAGYRLAPDLPHLARDLAAAGYATGGAVSSFVLRAETGLGEGFDLYDDAVPLRRRTGLGGQQRAGEETLDAVLPWLRRAAAERGERPFFLFLHLYEPHTPYAPPLPFAGRGADPYDGEIAAADAVVGRLLAELRRLDVYGESLVILLSDHGEGLGDHGEEEHGVLLYREALQVPLIVKPSHHGGAEAEGPATGRGVWPAAGSRVRADAALVDVYPTVMEAATGDRFDGARQGAAGRSLRALAAAAAGFGRPARAVYAETYYPRLHFGWSEMVSVVRGDLHFVGGPAGAVGVRPELFDLAADPGESRDLAQGRRRELAELRRHAADLNTRLRPPGAEDAETRRRLASLGYLGGATACDGPRPDPRGRLPVLAELTEGMRLAAADRFPEAVTTLSQVTAAEPAMVDAWEALARAHRGAGEPARALDAYQRGLRLSPDAPQLAVGAGAVLLELERPADAAEHALLARNELPAEAGEVLVRAALLRGDVATAARHASTAVKAAPDSPAVHLLAAEARAAEGRPGEALAAVERAATLAAGGPPVPGLDRLRGHTLARLGRAAEAEAAFEAEIARFPSEPRAYSELALLHALAGRPEAAVATLRRLVAVADTPRAYLAASRTLRVLGDDAGATALRRHGAERFPASPALAVSAPPRR